MKRKTMAIIAGAAIVGASIAGVGIASGSSHDDNDASDTPITGEALDRASAAALDHLGEGTVTETEDGDEESRYEVEVTLDDGSQVDVQLDEDFNVVSTEADDDGEDGKDD